LMWYDDVLPLSKTTLAALFVVGMIYIHTYTKSGEKASKGMNTHVDIGPVDRECAFVLPDDHRHLSVNGVFLRNNEWNGLSHAEKESP
jgi:hypothetical protein